MTTILQVFIKLNRFMMSYFGHVHIHLAGEEKYAARNIAKPGGLLHDLTNQQSITLFHCIQRTNQILQ